MSITDVFTRGQGAGPHRARAHESDASRDSPGHRRLGAGAAHRHRLGPRPRAVHAGHDPTTAGALRHCSPSLAALVRHRPDRSRCLHPRRLRRLPLIPAGCSRGGRCRIGPRHHDRLIAGTRRGWLDDVLMRLVDVLLSIPATCFVSSVVSCWASARSTRPSPSASRRSPQFARLARSQAVQYQHERLRGRGLRLRRHLLAILWRATSSRTPSLPCLVAGGAADRDPRDPPDLNTRLPRLRHPAADPRMGASSSPRAALSWPPHGG